MWSPPWRSEPLTALIMSAIPLMGFRSLCSRRASSLPPRCCDDGHHVRAHLRSHQRRRLIFDCCPPPCHAHARRWASQHVLLPRHTADRRRRRRHCAILARQLQQHRRMSAIPLTLGDLETDAVLRQAARELLRGPVTNFHCLVTCAICSGRVWRYSKRQ